MKIGKLRTIKYRCNRDSDILDGFLEEMERNSPWPLSVVTKTYRYIVVTNLYHTEFSRE